MNSFAITSKEMLKFISDSPTCFHAADNLKRMLDRQGFEQLNEQDEYAIKKGGRYYVIRNGSSILAFVVPEGEIKGFHMSAAHSDSPCFKIKEKPEMITEDRYVKLNVEKYGGMIDSTWLDRPLSVAGRVVVKEDGAENNGVAGLVTKLVNIDRDLLMIPNLAVHMNRDMNKGYEYNAQTDLIPLFGEYSKGDEKDCFIQLVAAEAGVSKEKLLGYDLYLYVREKGRFFGGNEEYVFSPRLDDLQCAYSCMKSLAESTPKEYINVCVVFDNEEVGSGTKQGADSTFLKANLKRIHEALSGKDEKEEDKAGKTGSRVKGYKRLLADSFMISADNAHAVHPNHPEKGDPTNRPYLNGGIVIKFHGSQRYTTAAFSGAVMKDICNKAEVPYQTYHNRSDIAGGSTLGNISTAHVSVNTVDIGLPQLAMHSACETAGAKDTEYLIRAMKCYYEE